MAIMIPTEVDRIVMEASSPDDRKFMRNTMSKQDINQINAALVQKLYENVVKYNKCDFGNIPKSKGRVMKVEGMDETVECLDILLQLHEKHGIPTEDITEIKKLISTLNRLGSSFEYGFRTDNDYLVITYNTIVMAIMDATSKLIADYTSYMVTPDNVHYTGVAKHGKMRGKLSIDMVKRFNALTVDGTLDSTVSAIVTNTSKSSAGTRTQKVAATESFAVSALIGTVGITAGVLFGIKALISLVRETIFIFYHSRVKMADYLNTQAAFLEMNRQVVENSAKSASQKEKVLQKQSKVILTLRRLADKIKINSEDTSVQAEKTLDRENSVLTLPAIEKQAASDIMNGTSIQVI